MAKKSKVLKIGHVSSLTTLPSSLFRSSIEHMLDTVEPVVASGTEMFKRVDDLSRVAAPRGYRVIYTSTRERECAFLLHKDARLRGRHTTQLHPKGPKNDPFGARFLHTIEFDWEDDLFAHSAAHFLAHLNDSALRLRYHNQGVERAAEMVSRFGSRNALSFFAGDTNEDDKAREDAALGQINTIFPRHGIITCWDESGEYPGTFGNRAIDVIARCKINRRVSLKWARTYNVQGDHDQIAAAYAIEDR